MGYRFLTFSNQKFLYPQTEVTKFVRRETATTLGRVYGLTEPEINTVLEVYGVETYNPLFPLRTAKLLEALEQKAGGKPLNNKYYLTLSPSMKYALDFTGVSLVVVPKGVNPALTLWNSSTFEKDITKVYSDDANDVYQNHKAIPRYGLYWDVRQSISDDRALEIIKSHQVDFTKTVLVQEHLGESITNGTGSAQLVQSGINSISFKAETDKPAVLYLSDSYDTGWHASVNGKETSILHANNNFRGVLVPSGTSVVRFWYLPMSVVIGAVVSVCGLVVLLLFIIFSGKINNGHAQSKQTDQKSHPK